MITKKVGKPPPKLAYCKTTTKNKIQNIYQWINPLDESEAKIPILSLLRKHLKESLRATHERSNISLEE